MKKKLLLMACVIMLLCMGCGKKQTNESSLKETGNAETSQMQEEGQADEKNYKIGFACPLLNAEYFKTIEEDVKEACRENGIDYTMLCAETDVTKQVEQIENLVTMGMDCIIVYPLDPVSMQDCMKSAREKGVKIVVGGSMIEEKEAYDAIVNADQTLVGKAAAQAAADWIDATFPDAEDDSIEVVVIGAYSSSDTIARSKAFEEVENLTSKAVVVEVYDMGAATDYAAKSQEYTELAFQSHKDVKCFITYTDTYALAVDETIMRTAGVDPEKMGVFTVDSSQAAFKCIENSKTNKNTLRACVQSGESFGTSLVETALEQTALDDEKIYYVDAFIISADNVESFIE